MPTFDNGGVLLLWLVVVAVACLGALALHTRLQHCADCGRDIGRKLWFLDGNRLVLCRHCFVRRVQGGR